MNTGWFILAAADPTWADVLRSIFGSVLFIVIIGFAIVLAIYWVVFPWLAIVWLRKIHAEVQMTRKLAGEIRADAAERDLAEWERKHPPQELP